jgi:phytoene dehydrogenase-like protein
MAHHDAVIIGAGPNSLVAGNVLADAGWQVLVLEAQDRIGGAVASDSDVHAGFIHDIVQLLLSPRGRPDAEGNEAGPVRADLVPRPGSGGSPDTSGESTRVLDRCPGCGLSQGR